MSVVLLALSVYSSRSSLGVELSSESSAARGIATLVEFLWSWSSSAAVHFAFSTVVAVTGFAFAAKEFLSLPKASFAGDLDESAT